VIKATFCHPKKLADNDTWVLEVLLATSLDIQQSMFKLAMKSNACATMAKLFDVNPLTWLQCTFLASKIFVCAFFEYFKLAKLTTNLGLVVKMFSQKFYTFHKFPYAYAYEEWCAKHP